MSKINTKNWLNEQKQQLESLLTMVEVWEKEWKGNSVMNEGIPFAESDKKVILVNGRESNKFSDADWLEVIKYSLYTAYNDVCGEISHYEEAVGIEIIKE